MIYTQEQLNSMSTQDIGKAVLKRQYQKSVEFKEEYPSNEVLGFGDKGEYLGKFNIDDWNYVMAISEKHRLSVNFDNFADNTYVCDPSIGIMSHHVNLKRAICEVFLMLDVEQ